MLWPQFCCHHYWLIKEQLLELCDVSHLMDDCKPKNVFPDGRLPVKYQVCVFALPGPADVRMGAGLPCGAGLFKGSPSLGQGK